MKSFHFTKLNLPAGRLRLREGKDGRAEVYDALRRRWIVLTDEEWVRQHFVAYLQERLGYPASMIANEVGLNLNRTARRVDTVVFGSDAAPAMIIEYKAPTIEITQKVFDQIVRYNMVLNARLIVVSNGLTHYCCAVDTASGGYRFLPEIPTYEALVAD